MIKIFGKIFALIRMLTKNEYCCGWHLTIFIVQKFLIYERDSIQYYPLFFLSIKYYCLFLNIV